MKKKKRQVKSIAQIAGGSVIAQVNQVLGEADDFVGVLADGAVGSVQALREQLGLGIGLLRDSLESIGDGSLAGARKALSGASGYVRQHPWQTAAGVIALGLTATMLTREGSMPRLASTNL
ncbi:MAG TPA: hypothetical protein VM369_04615 [Candidatus Binatia bacterium]|nr:hypothetical protein [Candidatus Binatia bacterium]